MLRSLFILLIIIPLTVCGQQYAATDTITDNEKAVTILHHTIKQFPKDPMLYCQLAERKNQLSQYDSAIYFSNKCMELLMTTKNNLLLARALHAKANAQYYLDDKIKAEENWRHSLQLAVEEKESQRIFKLASNLGAIYLDKAYQIPDRKGDYHTADSFFAISYRELQRVNATESIYGALTLRLMATSFHFQQQYDSAGIYYRKAIQASKQNAGIYTGALALYAEFLTETGRLDDALKTMEEVMQIMKDSVLISKDKIHYMHTYSRVLFKNKNYPLAYESLDSSFQILIADYKKANATAYAESESKFKNQLLQYQVQLERQRKNKLYYIIGGVLLLALLIFLWLQNRNAKRIEKEKAHQKRISIDAFIEGEEKEKVRIGRELHDGIAQEIVAVKLAMQQQNADPKVIEELTRISVDIRNISHELMPQTLKEYGLKLAIEDICQKILAPSGIGYEVISTLPDERLTNKIEITLYRIFQELVHNIIKHSHATEVLVQLRKMNKHIMLVVEDNGRGMTKEKKSGIGISNLESRVQLVDGNLLYDSTENEGTTAIVRVPL